MNFQKASVAILFFLLFLLQFIYFPVGFSHFEAPKVYVAEVAIFLLLLITFVSTNKFSLKNYQKPFLRSIVLLVGLSIVHLLFMHTHSMLFGNEFRHQGVFLLWILLIFTILSSKLTVAKPSPYFIVGVLVAQLILTLLIEGINGRAVGTLGEPNALAAAVVAIWPFIFFSTKKKWVVCIAIVATILIILLSGSRSGMIAFAVQLVFLGLIQLFHTHYKNAVLISLVLILVTYALPFIDQKGLFERRSEVWSVAVQAGLEKPLFGHGFGNTEYALKNTAEKTKNNLGTSYVDSSHNIFLDWWVQGGLIGLGILVTFLFIVIRSFTRLNLRLHFVLLLGLLTVLSFNPASVVTLVMFWWLTGQGAVKNA